MVAISGKNDEEAEEKRMSARKKIKCSVCDLARVKYKEREREKEYENNQRKKHH